MKICIVGAGAIGGFIGTELASSGHEVSVVARGATLIALREHGLRLQFQDRLISAKVPAADDPAIFGKQDLVVIAVKAPALTSVATRIAPLLGDDTMVLTAMNGVPWWFFDGFGGALEGTTLAAADPDGAIAQAIAIRRVIGCVVHATCTVAGPGLVQHGFGDRLIIGEPHGGNSQRIQAVAAMLRHAGFEIQVSAQIQHDIWYKLWGNMTINPVSAITGATSDRILDDELVKTFCDAVMGEASQIGSRIGCVITQSPADRNAVTRKLGAFKTSMLQDVEAGRPVEIDALLSVAREIGQKVGMPTPNLDALLGISRLHARVHGLYPPADLRRDSSTR